MKHLRFPGMLAGMLMAAILLAGCQQQRVIEYKDFQVHQIAANDRARVMRAAEGALLDLGFVIIRADAVAGKLQARSANSGTSLDLQVEPMEDRSVIRANARWGYTSILTPAYFEQLFRSVDERLAAS